jgi:gamma-glutamylcyclotransferase (GGCT)/AIG2-like uncharacterized protein YtfP
VSGLVNVFAYGTLQFPEIMQAVTERVFASEPASLPGHHRLALEGRAYPGVVPAPGQTTRGVVYRDVDPESVARLDVFESEIYERRLLRVTMPDGRHTFAFTYVLRPRFAHLLSRQLWSPERFRREHGADFLAACKHFREAGVE